MNYHFIVILFIVELIRFAKCGIWAAIEKCCATIRFYRIYKESPADRITPIKVKTLYPPGFFIIYAADAAIAETPMNAAIEYIAFSGFFNKNARRAAQGRPYNRKGEAADIIIHAPAPKPFARKRVNMPSSRSETITPAAFITQKAAYVKKMTNTARAISAFSISRMSCHPPADPAIKLNPRGGESDAPFTAPPVADIP
jgi:hypothetical protein